MRKQFWLLVMLVFVGVVGMNACNPSVVPTPSSDRVHVMVSIAPQTYFVERIGGDYVTVGEMVPPGVEPHTFEPKPEQLKALSQADVYFRIRIEFEDAWMDKMRSTNTRMEIVDTTEGIQRMPMFTGRGEETPGQAGETENPDPHIWLSPSLVKIQAQTIYNTLVQLDPDHQSVYETNLNQFLADITTLDRDIRQSLQGVRNRKFMVFHPSWGYFARDYDLEMIPIQVGGQEPSAAELANLITEAKQNDIKIVFAEPQFSQQAARAIAREIDGDVLLIDPLAPNWLDNLRQVATTFAKVLSQEQSFSPLIRPV
jgi:zinc transport system substrate-binding protein